MARHGRPVGLLALGVALLLLAFSLPAAASAAKDVRAVVLTNGPLAGRVSVVARVHHPADATRARDDVRVTLSRHGHVLATQVDPFRRSARAAIDAPHRIVLSATESRRARAAAKQGRLRVTVAPTATAAVARGIEAPPEARAFTQTVALTTSSEDPLETMYESATTASGPNVTVYQNDMAVFLVDITAFPSSSVAPVVAGWQGSVPITCGVDPADYGNDLCTWTNSGAEHWSFRDGPDPYGPVAGGGGSFSISRRTGFIRWDAADPLPAGTSNLTGS
jgi:hypothetical protein